MFQIVPHIAPEQPIMEQPAMKPQRASGVAGGGQQEKRRCRQQRDENPNDAQGGENRSKNNKDKIHNNTMRASEDKPSSSHIYQRTA
jgi:hypothetical protein